MDGFAGVGEGLDWNDEFEWTLWAGAAECEGCGCALGCGGAEQEVD